MNHTNSLATFHTITVLCVSFQDKTMRYDRRPFFSHNPPIYYMGGLVKHVCYIHIYVSMTVELAALFNIATPKQR